MAEVAQLQSVLEAAMQPFDHAICLGKVSDGLAVRDVQHLAQLSPQTRGKLQPMVRSDRLGYLKMGDPSENHARVHVAEKFHKEEWLPSMWMCD